MNDHLPFKTLAEYETATAALPDFDEGVTTLDGIKAVIRPLTTYIARLKATVRLALSAINEVSPASPTTPRPLNERERNEAHGIEVMRRELTAPPVSRVAEPHMPACDCNSCRVAEESPTLDAMDAQLVDLAIRRLEHEAGCATGYAGYGPDRRCDCAHPEIVATLRRLASRALPPKEDR